MIFVQFYFCYNGAIYVKYFMKRGFHATENISKEMSVKKKQQLG